MYIIIVLTALVTEWLL